MKYDVPISSGDSSSMPKMTSDANARGTNDEDCDVGMLFLRSNRKKPLVNILRYECRVFALHISLTYTLYVYMWARGNWPHRVQQLVKLELLIIVRTHIEWM